MGTMDCQILKTVVVRKWDLNFKKSQLKVFKNNGLDVIIECNMKIVRYLDVIFNSTTTLTDPTINQIA